MEKYICKNGTVINVGATTIKCHVQHTINTFDLNNKPVVINLSNKDWSDFLYVHEQYQLKLKKNIESTRQPK